MQLTHIQKIIVASVGGFILLILLVAFGILPGVRKLREKPPEVELTIWGIDHRSLFQEAFTSYESFRPNVKVDYEQIDPVTYEQDIINALAGGTGPDVVMFHNSWLPKHYNKIVPLDPLTLTFKDFQTLFPVVVEQDFAPTQSIYALPLFIDTLALLYNQDIFDKNGIAVTPADWLEFQNIIPNLRQKNADGAFVKSSAAIGGSAKTISYAPELLQLLMLQAGAQMTDVDFQGASFSAGVNQTRPGADALEFYTKFTNANDVFYTWNDNQKDAYETFAQGDVAMTFGYAGTREYIKEKNPFINFSVGPMPQPSARTQAVNFADYWGLAVTNNGANPTWAWDLIFYLTTNEQVAEAYTKLTNRPPALRNLIQKYVDHPTLGVFAKQALSARSWPRIDKKIIDGIFSQMIDSVISGKLDASEAISEGEQQVTNLMQSRKPRQ
ncbi:MAG: extracellular solute-binding protein [bacterium]|nr:extracellular solute-binding protein [bacterium]